MDKYLGNRLEGRYEIQELIGSGGMANVYKAYDIIDEKTVAVKILRDEYLNNTEFLRRFKNESKAIAVLSHPNIVKVFDVSFTGKNHSIVMEYIDGITLKDYIQKRGPLEWKEAAHFTLEILRALQHAHEKGIVHRDIKPQNIMLLKSGTIKVTDFGIARFARSEVQTITDRAIGSVHYISPEQAMGENTDAKSDIYSVGVMLFEMLTGALPFEADSPVSVAIKQIQTQAVKPTSINPSIPEGLEDITVRAMQKDAANRYQTAADMIRDIERFRQDPAITFPYKYPPAQKRQSGDGKRRRANQDAKGDNMQRRRRKTPYIPILTGVTVAFVLASAGFMALMITLNNPFIQVDEEIMPDLVGVKYETAVSQHDYLEFVAEREPSNDQPSGVIFEQSVAAGRAVKVNTPIKVKVSTGQAEVTLIDYAGRDANDTMNKLKEMGLVVTEQRTYDGNVPVGSVIYTEPSMGSVVSAGDPVTVFVSMGPETTLSNVPDVLGMKVDEAKTYLELNKLKLGEITYEFSDSPEDTIISQYPAPGSLQTEGAGVGVTVSKGKEEEEDDDEDEDDVDDSVVVEQKTLGIQIALPNVDREVVLQAKQDGAVVAEEKVYLAEVSSWKPRFQGRSDQVSEIRIYIDNQLYIAYSLHFEDNTYYIDEDRSANFS